MAKILIIDDEEQLRRLMARIIGLEGYEVAEAPDCASGMNRMRFVSSAQSSATHRRSASCQCSCRIGGRGSV